MSENEQKESDNKLESLDAAELVKIIKETRSEAAQRRIKEKELEAKLSELTSQKEKEETDKKLAEGKKDEVITDLKNQLESYKSKADKFDSYDKSKREQIKTNLGDEYWLPSFDAMPLNELEQLATKFNKGETVPDTDSGNNKKKNNVINPFDKKTFNITSQIELMRTNPKLAQQLKAEAN